MNCVYIALGSNLDSPSAQLTQALQRLDHLPMSKLVKYSSFYRSQPLGPQDQPDYINAVACLHTALSPLVLLDALQNIENEQGRIRARRWGERTLDLDILLYNNDIMDSERLTVPHYDMYNREFVIVPLYEIAPNLVFPDGKKIADLIPHFAHHTMQKCGEF
ncbi:2-amino-4-hydroxy-6-hydroxymethyldihydropteridine diphosphokinase [Conservatibacter flavescens]|uniref:2-amino-4-hydroxy-6-hydroxymethyldihydropteridine pyrophosphokinase n=1 Tax=Conservatibacter flavescens TaxID=28161 RepID=A0A2M8S3Z7_9PAST|nr:2-amino-4-hydroxy-6-hydroxymethyldihydropteridine diphosphokinase [Conservatibacter flavescens]PJG85872.1 2-amino-4-hydroxy-6-hydroxymethyldihydropteridine diphosphokinase [Conservatibacter flavescens]